MKGRPVKGKPAKKPRGDDSYYQVVNVDTDEVLLEGPSLPRAKSEANRGYAISGQHHRVITRSTRRIVYTTAAVGSYNYCNPIVNQLGGRL